MGGLMWIVFIALLALLILSLLWLVWKLRHFSQSQNQNYVDDKLMHAMLKDQNFSKKIKKALVKKAGETTAAEEQEKSDAQEKKSAGPK